MNSSQSSRTALFSYQPSNPEPGRPYIADNGPTFPDRKPGLPLDRLTDPSSRCNRSSSAFSSTRFIGLSVCSQAISSRPNGLEDCRWYTTYGNPPSTWQCRCRSISIELPNRPTDEWNGASDSNNYRSPTGHGISQAAQRWTRSAPDKQRTYERTRTDGLAEVSIGAPWAGRLVWSVQSAGGSANEWR